MRARRFLNAGLSVFVSVCALFLGACAPPNGLNVVSVGDSCTRNDECGSGAVCYHETCTKVCDGDDECGVGMVCSGRLCTQLGGDDTALAPQITSVDGDSERLCVDTSHCVASAIVVEGARLADAAFRISLAGSDSFVELVAEDGTRDDRVVLPLPGILPGTYSLEATNAAGTTQESVSLLQGEPGPDLSADELVVRINTATETIDASVLPVGTGATDVAAGDHTHESIPELAVGDDVGLASGPFGVSTVDLLDESTPGICFLRSVDGKGECQVLTDSTGAQYMLARGAGTDETYCVAKCLTW